MNINYRRLNDDEHPCAGDKFIFTSEDVGLDDLKDCTPTDTCVGAYKKAFGIKEVFRPLSHSECDDELAYMEKIVQWLNEGHSLMPNSSWHESIMARVVQLRNRRMTHG